MIICCGEALIDMVRTPGGEGFLPLPGGSPYNTAVAIGRLGAPVQFLGRFSIDFFGEILVKGLRENNVGDGLIVRSSQNSTLAFVNLEKDKEPEYVFYTEGSADRSFELADLPKNLPADASCILFGSIAMTMEPAASTVETLIIREGKRKNADQVPVISFDPNIRPFMIKNKEAYIKRFEKWLTVCTVVKISSADFDFIYPGLSIEQAVQKTLSLGPSLVICTLGPKGAMAVLRGKGGKTIRVAAPVVDLPVVDTIGAGDTFHGAFLSWLEINGKMSGKALEGLGEEDLYKALLFANKAASIVCSRRGADPPSLKEVEELPTPF
jgi:fructokinase